MTRRDWLWIGLKFFGLYLLLQAVLAIPDVLQGGSLLYSGYGSHVAVNPGSGSSFDAAADTMARSLVSSGRAMLVGSIASLVIFGTLGFYFALGGKKVLNAICRGEASP